PREAPRVPRGAPRGDQDVALERTRAHRQLHAVADASRPGGNAAGHRMARRPDQSGAPTGEGGEGPEARHPSPFELTHREGACWMTKGKIRLGIVGVGNCASALVQGLEFYKDAHPGEDVPGLMHVRLGDYHVSDVEVACAFDVDAK